MGDNLPPGVSVSDLPGNRGPEPECFKCSAYPSMEAMEDGYPLCEKHDTPENRDHYDKKKATRESRLYELEQVEEGETIPTGSAPLVPREVVEESVDEEWTVPQDPRRCKDCGHVYALLVRHCPECGSTATWFVDGVTLAPTDGFGTTVETFKCYDCGVVTPRERAIFENRAHKTEFVVSDGPYHRRDPRYNPETETRTTGIGKVPVCPVCSRTEETDS